MLMFETSSIDLLKQAIDCLNEGYQEYPTFFNEIDESAISKILL